MPDSDVRDSTECDGGTYEVLLHHTLKVLDANDLLDVLIEVEGRDRSAAITVRN